MKAPGDVWNIIFSLGTGPRNAFQKLEYKIVFSPGTGLTLGMNHMHYVNQMVTKFTWGLKYVCNS